MSGDSKYKILFEGDRLLGSDAYSAYRALIRLGHTVCSQNYKNMIPEAWSSFHLKAIRKIIRPLLILEHNGKIVQMARDYKPDIFIAFKGSYVTADTIRKMRQMGIATYNYYPDVSAFSHGVPSLPAALAEYDCVFSTKTFFARDMARNGYPLKHHEFFPHGYDPDAHHPVTLLDRERAMYESDVTFIGVRSERKEMFLAGLKRLAPEVKLSVWGYYWDRARSPYLRGSIVGRPALEIEYMKALCGSRIALGLLSERVKGSSEGDKITSRTFSIPATGSFMMHQRTDEVGNYFVEGEEIECFETVEELAEKVRYYLDHPGEREKIARAGYERCVPAYVQDNRVQKIIDWHRARK